MVLMNRTGKNEHARITTGEMCFTYMYILIDNRICVEPIVDMLHFLLPVIFPFFSFTTSRRCGDGINKWINNTLKNMLHVFGREEVCRGDYAEKERSAVDGSVSCG